MDELRNLPPEERIKKLKELEEEKKKEIEEARKLIADSQREIVSEQEKKEQLPIDQLKAGNAEDLETLEEKELFETKRFVKIKKKESDKETGEDKEITKVPDDEGIDLEHQLAEVPSTVGIATAQHFYGSETPAVRPEFASYEPDFSQLSAAELHARARNLYEETRIVRESTENTHASEPAYKLTPEQRGIMYAIENAADERRTELEEGNYRPKTTAEEVIEDLSLAKKVLKYLRG